MHKFYLAASMAICIFLTGCIGLTKQQLVPEMSPDYAVVYVKDTFFNFPKANGSIRKVDGNTRSALWHINQPGHAAELHPGKHTIEVVFYSQGLAFTVEVEGDLAAGNVYEIVAVESEYPNFLVTLERVVGEERNIIVELDVAGHRSP